MYSVRFQTTSDSAIPPPDLPVSQTWAQLVDLLARDVSAEAGRLLAEPVADAGRGETHWHVECEHDPIPLAKLSDAQRVAILEKLETRRTAVRARADALQKLPSEASQRTAAVLRQLVEVPDESCIWSVDNEPVLTCWARTRLRSGQRDRIIRGEAEVIDRTPPTVAANAASAAAVRTAPAEPPRRSWPPWLWSLLPWLAFLTLIAIIYAKLLAACGLLLPDVLGGRTFCPVVVATTPETADGQNDDLRHAVASLQARLANLEPCANPAAAPSAAAPRPDTPLDNHEVEKRLGEQNIGRGIFDISLAWNGHADLDLRVNCPGGEITFKSRDACGGVLDKDANNGNYSVVERPVEHAIWTGPTPRGHYRVEVEMFDYRDAAQVPVPYTVVIRDGTDEKSYRGVIQRINQRNLVIEFDR